MPGREGGNLHLSNLSAFLAISASHQDSLIPQALDRLGTLNKLLERRMGLDKVLFRQRDAQLLAQLSNPGALVLPTAICQQNKGYIVMVQVFECGCRAWNRG